MLCPTILNSNTIELTVHTSCYWVLDLLCVTCVCWILDSKTSILICGFLQQLVLQSDLLVTQRSYQVSIQFSSKEDCDTLLLR